MGAHSIKNWGWVVAQRKCLDGSTIPLQAHPRCKVVTRGYQIDLVITSPMLHWGQSNSGENCILLESRSTRSIIAKLPQHSSSTVCEFRTTSKECCKSGYGCMCVKHCCRLSWRLKCIKNGSYVCELTICKNLSWWVVTQKTSKKKHSPFKIGEWAFAWWIQSGTHLQVR